MALVEWVARESAHLVVDGDILTLCGQMRGEAPAVTVEQIVERRTPVCEGCVEASGQLSLAVTAFVDAAEAVRRG